MFKLCVKAADKPGIKLFKNGRFYTGVVVFTGDLRISGFYTQLYKPLVHVFINIKYLLNYTVPASVTHSVHSTYYYHYEIKNFMKYNNNKEIR